LQLAAHVLLYVTLFLPHTGVYINGQMHSNPVLLLLLLLLSANLGGCLVDEPDAPGLQEPIWIPDSVAPAHLAKHLLL
jgi:hypothetical protein